MTMTVQIKKKKKTISKQLQEAIDSIPSPDFEKLQPKVDRVFAIGREEGLSDKEIGKLIRQKMKEHYSRQTIWEVFAEYPDAKNPNMRRFGKKSLPNDENGADNDDEKETDKYQHYKQVIESKNKLLKQKDEELIGLKKQLAQANKRIHELESQLKNSVGRAKSDLLNKALRSRGQIRAEANKGVDNKNE